jgi:hypothetical protein
MPERSDIAMRLAQAFSAAAGVNAFAEVTTRPWRQDVGQTAFEIQTRDERAHARVVVSVSELEDVQGDG